MLRKLWFKNRMIWRVRWDRACICQRGWDFDMPVLVAEVWLVKREFNYWWAGGWYEIINGWWDLSLRFRLHGGPWWLMFHLHDWCSWIQVPSGYDIHSSPWKDPPFLSSVNHLFRLGPSIPWRTVSHNQRLFQAVIFGIGSWGFRVDPCLPKRCYNECIYIHIHTYTYIYIHIHTTYTYIYIHIQIYIYIYHMDSYGGFLKCGYPHIKYQKPMVTSGSTIAWHIARSKPLCGAQILTGDLATVFEAILVYHGIQNS